MALDPVALDLADKAGVESAALPSCRAASEFSKDFGRLYANRSFRELRFAVRTDL
jgi:hypothetical protein